MNNNLLVTISKKFFGFSILLLLAVNMAFSQTSNSARTVAHLLDYVSRDYEAAVKNGVVIDDGEYEEQLEFSEQAYNLTNEEDFLEDEQKKEVLNDINLLQNLIKNKESTELVSEKASAIRKNIINFTGLATAPNTWPNLKSGSVLYEKNCASCHGNNGDGNGYAGINLDPRPTNFLEQPFMKELSPYQSFSTIKLGVPGTGMIAYDDILSESELWDLAFYVKSMMYIDKSHNNKKLEQLLDNILGNITLADVASLNDIELQEKLHLLGIEDGDVISAIRLSEPNRNSLNITSTKLKLALDFYKKGDKKSARMEALNAYLEGVEPVEARLKANSPSFVVKIEQQMLDVRQAIEKDRGVEVVENEIIKALELVDEANELLESNELNYWLTFLIALAIMLREGVEAFLVIGVVMVLIKNAGVTKALKWLHGGWIFALLMGVVGWFLSDYIIQISGRNREIMEGLVTILAVIILLYAGFWLHSNSQAKKWQQFISQKVGKYLTSDRMFGLAFFSFMVVFREAFEVIIFLQSINIEAAASNKSAIGLGVLTASVLIVIIVLLFQKYAKKIPLKELFLYSSWIIIILAIILAGKGVHSLQESGMVSVNGLGFVPRFDLIGLYPTLETILAQFVVILISFISIRISRRGIEKII